MLSPLVRAARFFRLAILACLAATAVVLSIGCERQIAPPLIEVTDLAPRQIEPGDRLEVHGAGFPQGRTGRVTLEGTVYRPGEPPGRGVSIDLEGKVASPDRLEVLVREPLAERLCGRGDQAAHATFEGDVEVAFSSNVPGAPPLIGVLRGATIDVVPSSARASILDARIAEGGRVLAFLGIVPAAPSPRGLPVEQVRPGSIAERSGIEVGDVLASVDGVHVLSQADVVPSSARAMTLGIRRGESGALDTKTISLVGYSGERVPAEYAPALLVVGLGLVVLVLLGIPGPPPLVALELRIAAHVRRTTVREVLVALAGTGRDAALSALGSAVIAGLALTPYVVGREVDGLVLLAAGAAMLVASRLPVQAGTLASLAALARLGLAAVAAAAAVALSIGQVGAIELAEIVRVQGGAPWQFNAARHPSCAVLAVVYAVAVVALLRARPLGVDASPRARLLERAGLLLVSALGVTTFLGGWQLPGAVEPRAHGLLLVSAGVFVAKTWTVFGLLLGAGRVLTRTDPRETAALVSKRLAPMLAVGGGLVVASRRVVPGAAIEAAFGVTLVALVVLFGIRMAARVRAAAARPEPHASPFL